MCNSFTWRNTISTETIAAGSTVNAVTPVIPQTTLSFLELGIDASLLESATNFTHPTPIQLGAIPPLLLGHDLLGQAHTGSGKTAAFALPILQKLQGINKPGVQALILAPTRELAKQISVEFERFGKKAQTKTAIVVGGESSFRQIELINRGAQIVVATPGRMLDLLQSGRLKKFIPTTVVLDEADEMLDMGFIDDIRTILGIMPKERQTVMFSATLPGPIARLAQEIMNQPVSVRLGQAMNEKGPDIEQRLYIVKPNERALAVVRLLEVEEPEKAIIFCRMKRDVDELDVILRKNSFKSRALHGDMAQNSRDQVINAFKQGECRILIATDVASRGLDIASVSHVINFQIPDNSERFTHRIGRTGRAGQKGIALSIATPQELRTHGFFKHSAMKKMNLCMIPNRTDLEAKKLAALTQEILGVSVSRRAELVAARLMAQDVDSTELLSKVVSLLLGDVTASGPEMIGYSPDQIQMQRPSSYSSSNYSSSSSNPRRRTSGGPQRDRRPPSSGRSFPRSRRPDDRPAAARTQQSMN